MSMQFSTSQHGSRQQSRQHGRRTAGVTLLAGAALCLPVALLPSPALSATLTGTNKGERIIGTNNADTIKGLGGNDRIGGRGGNDVLRGGKGEDRINGDGGNDTIVDHSPLGVYRGGAGNDTITSGKWATAHGGTGHDKLTGGGYLDGGTGNDTITVRYDNTSVSTGLGYNTVSSPQHGVYATLEGFTDTFTSGPGIDSVSAGASTNATIRTGGAGDYVSLDGAGVRTVDTGGGDDEVSITNAFDMDPGTRISCGAGYDTVSFSTWAGPLASIDASCERVVLLNPSGVVIRRYR